MKKIIMFLLSAMGVLTSCNRGMVPPSGPPGDDENILMYGPVPVEFQNTPKPDDSQQQIPNASDQIRNTKNDNNETDSEN